MHLRRLTFLYCLLTAGLMTRFWIKAAPPPTQMSQLTFVPGFFTEYPSIDAGGNQIAFESNADLVPGSNPTATTQIFVMNVDGSGLTQLTHGTNKSANASLNASGDKVTFLSFDDLVSGQNTDANSEIFSINADGTALKQLTHTTGGTFVGTGFLANDLPSFNYSGKQIVFVSSLDLTSSGNTDNSADIYAMNSDGSKLTQLTNTPFGANSASPCFDPSGKRVFFLSDGNWTGENPNFVGQLFTMNVDKTGIIQLTHAPAPGLNENEKTAVDASAGKAVFTSRSDLVSGGNADGNSEIYMLDIKSGGVTQITSTVGGRGCWAPAISANGKTVVFTSDRDLVGSNPTHSWEIFMARVP